MTPEFSGTTKCSPLYQRLSQRALAVIVKFRSSRHGLPDRRGTIDEEASCIPERSATLEDFIYCGNSGCNTTARCNNATFSWPHDFRLGKNACLAIEDASRRVAVRALDRGTNLIQPDASGGESERFELHSHGVFLRTEYLQTPRQKQSVPAPRHVFARRSIIENLFQAQKRTYWL
jgi:hypothetical protein